MMTMRSTSSTSNPENYRQGTFWLYRALNCLSWEDSQADWGYVCGPYCNDEKNERGLKFLGFATFCSLVLTNILGPYKDGGGPVQMTSTKIRLIKSWWGSAFIQELTSKRQSASLEQIKEVTMTWWWRRFEFRVRLKKARKPTQLSLRVALEKRRDPGVACTFQAI